MYKISVLRKTFYCEERIEIWGAFKLLRLILSGSTNNSVEKRGNCLRFFELQSVSTKALRKKLDMAPGSFHCIWKQFKKCCKIKAGKLNF